MINYAAALLTAFALTFASVGPSVASEDPPSVWKPGVRV